jgi:hypothetical protein
MAGTLRYEFGQDALAASLDKNTPETLHLLMTWAERIIVMERSLTELIPESHRIKMVLVNVGHDRWVNPMNDDLLRIVNERVRRWEARGFTAGGEV